MRTPAGWSQTSLKHHGIEGRHIWKENLMIRLLLARRTEAPVESMKRQKSKRRGNQMAAVQKPQVINRQRGLRNNRKSRDSIWGIRLGREAKTMQ